MKLQKIILCAAVALTAFGTSLGLFELGSYLRAGFQPLKVERQPPEPFTSPVYAPARRILEFKTPVLAPTEETEPEEPEDSDKTGYYYIIRDNPKGFADFEWLDLSTYKFDLKLNKTVKVKLSGWIDTKKGRFEFSSLNITGKRILIVTETQKGISYQFDGKFIEEEVKAKYSDGSGEYMDTAVLKGRLTKWRNGVKIAEANVKLGVTQGC